MDKIEQLEIALKILKAEEAGKPLEWQVRKAGREWMSPGNNDGTDYYMFQGFEIRLKPWTLGRAVNGHTLPEGKEWHRQDFTQEMLPPPYRPLMLGETGSYEIFAVVWHPGTAPASPFSERHNHCRTTRPIPKPEWVDLGPSGIPPGSVLLYGAHWISITGVQREGVSTKNRSLISWKELNQQWSINRPNHRDADGNPTLWEPCRKLKES